MEFYKFTLVKAKGNKLYLIELGTAERLNRKISTMISFQKDSKIWDCMGTEPNILDQEFWKEDYQLNKLIDIIKTQ